VKVSCLCFGTDNFADPTPEEESVEMLNRALDAGINLLDTGDIYAEGEGERIIGRALWDIWKNSSPWQKWNSMMRLALLAIYWFHLAGHWRREYNRCRPHSSLGYRPPAPEAFEAANLTLQVVH
jgi:transposase InsO family protein